MAYVPPWEWLSDALTRVMEANGLSQNDAQAEICRAIADRAVRIQAKLARQAPPGHMTSRDTVLKGEDFSDPNEPQTGGLGLAGVTSAHTMDGQTRSFQSIRILERRVDRTFEDRRYERVVHGHEGRRACPTRPGKMDVRAGAGQLLSALCAPSKRCTLMARPSRPSNPTRSCAGASSNGSRITVFLVFRTIRS